MSFPILVYRCPGMHFAHDGQTYEYTQARNEDELEARLSAGWHKSLADAVSAASGDDVTDDHAPATRAELEEMATDLGIKFDGRTTDAALLRRIEAATSGEE